MCDIIGYGNDSQPSSIRFKLFDVDRSDQTPSLRRHSKRGKTAVAFSGTAVAAVRAPRVIFACGLHKPVADVPDTALRMRAVFTVRT